MLFYSFLREIPENTPLQRRLIILHVQKTCISSFFNKYMSSPTTLQHLNNCSNCTNLSKFNANNYRKIRKTKHRRSSMPNSAPARHVEMIKAGHIPTCSAD